MLSCGTIEGHEGASAEAFEILCRINHADQDGFGIVEKVVDENLNSTGFWTKGRSGFPRDLLPATELLWWIDRARETNPRVQSNFIDCMRKAFVRSSNDRRQIWDVLRHNRQDEVLGDCDLQNMPPEVFELTRKHSSALRALHEAILELKNSMMCDPAAVSHATPERVGEICGYNKVPGIFTSKIVSITCVEVAITISAECSIELASRVAVQVRRGVERWCDSHPTFCVELATNHVSMCKKWSFGPKDKTK